MNSDFVNAAVIAILSGGLIGSVGSFLSSRAMARKLKVETNLLGDENAGKVDSIAIQGAETAVLTLERSLAAETRRADRAESKNLDYEKQVTTLKQKLDDLQETLNSVRLEMQALMDKAKH